MRTKPIARIVAAFGVAALAVGCGSTSSTKSGTQTLSASITGSKAIATLEGQNSNAPLTFPEITWAGVVSTTAHNVNLGGGGNGSEHTFETPAGDFAVTHFSQNPNGVGSATGPVNGVCSFKDVTSGTYTVVTDKSTGSFKGATGHGDFANTLSGTGPIQAKATTCSVGNNGPNISGIKSASIVFKASGPLTVKP
jgi:hypothetical protein